MCTCKKQCITNYIIFKHKHAHTRNYINAIISIYIYIYMVEPKHQKLVALCDVSQMVVRNTPHQIKNKIENM